MPSRESHHRRDLARTARVRGTILRAPIPQQANRRRTPRYRARTGCGGPMLVGASTCEHRAEQCAEHVRREHPAVEPETMQLVGEVGRAVETASASKPTSEIVSTRPIVSVRRPPPITVSATVVPGASLKARDGSGALPSGSARPSERGSTNKPRDQEVLHMLEIDNVEAAAWTVRRRRTSSPGRSARSTRAGCRRASSRWRATA